MENIKGIIFDYGGTLDSYGDHWSHVIRRAYNEAGIFPDETNFRDAYVEAERALARERIILPGDDFLATMKKKIAIEAERLVALGEIDQADKKRITDDVATRCYMAARKAVADATPLLSRLSTRYPLALVSNFYGNIDAILRDFGIRQFFKGVIESSVVGIRKPDPRIFRLGTIVLDLSPENVLVVGDSLDKDIIPARSIGCHTLWLKGLPWNDSDDLLDDPSMITSLSDIERMLPA